MKRPDLLSWLSLRRTAAQRLLIGARELVFTDADAVPLGPAKPDGGNVLARAGFNESEGLAGALASALPAVGQGAIDVVFATRWARLFLVNWVAEVNTAARWQGFAASRFEQIFGEAADGWVIRLTDEPPPRPRLAAALPSAAMLAVQAACGDRLASVRIGMLERVRRLIGNEPRFTGCAIEIDAGHAAVVVFVGGELRRVRARNYERVEELAPTIFAEWAAAGVGEAAPAALAIGGPSSDTVRASLVDALAGTLGGQRTLDF